MARFDRLTVYNTLLADGLLPLFYHGDAAIAGRIVGALAEGGCRLIEFTNRGDFAVEVFAGLVERCAAQHPQVILGVGTVEDAPTAAMYIAHGANFVVAPNFSEEVARLCNGRKIAYIPGCGTVNEIVQAETWGAEIVKLFPGESVGGPEFVRAVLGPRPHSRLMPSGGVTAEEANLRAWFASGVACVGMGSQLVRKAWVEAGDFGAIAAQARDTLATIHRVRAG
jgi:2-dehydro-3-deoxyphosphogluconate aldolase/(4S)-4-hydroxy-2-oxoglutarate aldolase